MIMTLFIYIYDESDPDQIINGMQHDHDHEDED